MNCEQSCCTKNVVFPITTNILTQISVLSTTYYYLFGSRSITLVAFSISIKEFYLPASRPVGMKMDEDNNREDEDETDQRGKQERWETPWRVCEWTRQHPPSILVGEIRLKSSALRRILGVYIVSNAKVKKHVRTGSLSNLKNTLR